MCPLMNTNLSHSPEKMSELVRLAQIVLTGNQSNLLLTNLKKQTFNIYVNFSRNTSERTTFG